MEKSNLRHVARQHECATTRRLISGLYCVLHGPAIYLCVFNLPCAYSPATPRAPTCCCVLTDLHARTEEKMDSFCMKIS